MQFFYGRNRKTDRMDKFLPEVKVKEVKPKFTLIRCVVCNGWGTVSNQKVRCHACEGKGYLEIPVEEVKNV